MVSDAGRGANEVKKGATTRLWRPQRGDVGGLGLLGMRVEANEGSKQGEF